MQHLSIITVACVYGHSQCGPGLGLPKPTCPGHSLVTAWHQISHCKSSALVQLLVISSKQPW